MLLVSPDTVDAEIVQRILAGHQVVVRQELFEGRQAYVEGMYDLVIIGPASYYWCMWADELMRSGQSVVLLINVGGWGNIPVISFFTNTLDPQIFLQHIRPPVQSS